MAAMGVACSRRLGLAVVAAAAVMLPAGAGAAVHWRCVLTADLVKLECDAHVAAAEAGPSSALRPAADTAADTAVVRGTRFPLDVARRWTVDLWSPPTDRAFVELLARSALCHRTPDCTASVEWAALTQRR